MIANRVCSKFRLGCLKTFAIVCASWILSVCYEFRALSEESIPKKLEHVGVVQRLGSSINPSIPFMDSSGKKTSLDVFLGTEKPLLLTLNYIRCGNLCSVQLAELGKSLQKMRLVAGKDFNLVTISIDPSDSQSMASVKQESLQKSLASKGSKWNLFTGSKESIEQLASQLGFSFSYDPKTNQFAHGAAVFFISPKAVISKYLFGLIQSPRDLQFGLIDASNGKIGTLTEKFLLRCFHFDELAGKYTPFAYGMMKSGALVCLVVLAIWFFQLWRKDKFSSNPKELVA